MVEAAREVPVDFSSSPGTRTIGELISHMFACQATVLRGLTTDEFPWREDEETFRGTSLDVLLERARDMDAALQQLVRAADANWFTSVPAGYKLDRRQWLWETLEHEIHHTGQLASMIRLAGGEPARIFG